MIYLLCSTIRPEVFKETHAAWIAACDNQKQIKTMVVVDYKEHADALSKFDCLLYDKPNRGITKPLTELTRSLQGLDDKDIIVVMSDDFFPPKHWDSFLIEQFSSFDGTLNVFDGTMERSQDTIISIPIMTYSCLKKLNGIIYHPIYTHGFSDNELRDILSDLKLLKKIDKDAGYTFEHRHFVYGKRKKDKYDLGEHVCKVDKFIYNRRKHLPSQQKLQLDDLEFVSPLIDCDFFKSLADVSFGDPYKNLKEISLEPIRKISDNKYNITIAIHTERLLKLMSILAPIKYSRFNILSINSDVNVDETIINKIPENVNVVWCQNYNGSETEKIKSIPGGLERTLWFPEVKKQEKLRQAMLNPLRTLPGEMAAYLNINTKTNPERQRIAEILCRQPFVKCELLGNGADYQHYINTMLKYRFIISPNGNGIDCHRTWEALYLNRIPILQKNKFNENIFGDMPALIVDGYDKLTIDMMHDFINNELPKKSSAKLYPEYWIRKMFSENQL